ncbi:MAG: HAMP domain-containing sensor histidine kinase [Patescibacteria group bacterium]
MFAEVPHIVEVVPMLVWGVIFFGTVAVFGVTLLFMHNVPRFTMKIVFIDFFVALIILTLFVEVFFARSVWDLVAKAGIAGLVVFASFFLLGSVKRELQTEAEIDKLLHDLDDTHARLQMLDHKKSEFVAIASHHLRSPLTAISGYTSLLMDGSYGQLSSSMQSAVSKILESSKRLIVMVSDFMDVTHIERGDMVYNFAEVDFKAMILNIAHDMEPAATRAHLWFDVLVEKEKTEDYITVGDLGKLRQVVTNLVDNAIKYTPKGGVSILLRKSHDKKHILFSISDTGIGMSKETLQKIFKKFSRAEGVSRVYTDGSGLGLYIAKRMIKKHEGRIWATSKGVGLGSTFSLELEVKHG